MKLLDSNITAVITSYCEKKAEGRRGRNLEPSHSKHPHVETSIHLLVKTTSFKNFPFL
jgi:hypothetical protein